MHFLSAHMYVYFYEPLRSTIIVARGECWSTTDAIVPAHLHATATAACRFFDRRLSPITRAFGSPKMPRTVGSDRKPGKQLCIPKSPTFENTDAGIVWKETSVGALLRLLEYVHREVSERLQDWHCAEQLETCIEHLKAECVL